MAAGLQPRPVLEVDEIKTIPGTPRSHAFVGQLIGTIRREYPDRIWFWNQTDLERKLEDYKAFYNQFRCHTRLTGVTPAQRSGAHPRYRTRASTPIAGDSTAMACFRPRPPRESEFATDRLLALRI